MIVQDPVRCSWFVLWSIYLNLKECSRGAGHGKERSLFQGVGVWHLKSTSSLDRNGLCACKHLVRLCRYLPFLCMRPSNIFQELSSKVQTYTLMVRSTSNWLPWGQSAPSNCQVIIDSFLANMRTTSHSVIRSEPCVIDQLLANCEFQAASSYLLICSSSHRSPLQLLCCRNWHTQSVHTYLLCWSRSWILSNDSW